METCLRFPDMINVLSHKNTTAVTIKYQSKGLIFRLLCVEKETWHVLPTWIVFVQQRPIPRKLLTSTRLKHRNTANSYSARLPKSLLVRQEALHGKPPIFFRGFPMGSKLTFP